MLTPSQTGKNQRKGSPGEIRTQWECSFYSCSCCMVRLSSLMEAATTAPVSALQRIDMAVLNIYLQTFAGLGPHQVWQWRCDELNNFTVWVRKAREANSPQDSRKCFKRPIISLRLFADSVLSFGAKKLTMDYPLFEVPLQRGVITLMEVLAELYFVLYEALSGYTNVSQAWIGVSCML